jgi:hypothetical protein
VKVHAKHKDMGAAQLVDVVRVDRKARVAFCLPVDPLTRLAWAKVKKEPSPVPFENLLWIPCGP